MKVAQSCPALCNPMDYTVHGLLQARILEWVAIPFSRGSSQPRDWIQVSCTAGRFFTSWATREVLSAFIACCSCTFWCHCKVEYRPEIGSVISVPLILRNIRNVLLEKLLSENTKPIPSRWDLCNIIELYYSFVLGIMVLGYKDGTDQNENRQLNRFGGIWKISLKIFLWL